MSAGVRFDGVKKSYDGRTLVVESLDLTVGEGEFLTFLGPSGSGKTTVLMMLAGFESPTAGSILIDGREVTKLPARHRGIGMVFQNYALFPHMTVAENLAFPLEVRSMDKGEAGRRVRAALETVRLTGFADRRPAKLSGGQQQRVALARALIFDPKLVLMDEPLGALDKNLREEMQYEIKALHDRLGLTVVYVTHDQDEALTMSDRVAVFDKGRIQQISSPQDLYERPLNVFVAGFIGENNRLPGQIVSLQDDRCIVSLGGDKRVVATPSGLDASHADAVVSVRPELIRIGRSAENADTVLDGRVEALIYHGDHLRVHVTGVLARSLVVKVPNDQRSGPPPAVGENVKVGWRAADCLAFSGTH